MTATTLIQRLLILLSILLAPLRILAADLATDSFGGSGDLSADWTVISGFELPQQSGGLAQPKTVNVGALALNTSIVWPANQCAAMPITTASAPGRFPGVILLGTTGARSNYQIDIQGPFGASVAMTIRRYVAGAAATLNSSTAAISSGDVLKGCAYNGVITAYLNDVPLFQASDSTYASGSPGFTVYTSSGAVTNAQVASWTGSDSSASALPPSGCSGAGNAWTCIAGSSVSDIQTAINNGTDDPVITFASGSYSWASSFVLPQSQGVTFICASRQACIVTTNGVIFQMGGTVTTNNIHPYRVSGFKFQNGNAAFLFWFYGSSGCTATSCSLTNWRIDNNWFYNYPSGNVMIQLGEFTRNLKFAGLIDHNLFSGPINVMAAKVWRGNSPDYWPSSIKGTAQNVFLEDNQFDFDTMTSGSAGSGCIDVYKAGNVVFRFNTVRNCLVTAHGVTHTTTVNFEAYGNTLERTAPAFWNTGIRSIHHQGSGEIYIWGNSITHQGTIAPTAISVTHYASAPLGETGITQCDGTNGIDGNLSPTGTYRGWPCWMQPGRAPAGGSPAYGTLSPMYNWLNVDANTGALVTTTIENPFVTTPTYFAEHFVANRDYYSAVSKDAQTTSSSPFDGTAGMGYGTLARRPATCSTGTDPEASGLGGVGYWATDQGSWNTSSTNPEGVQQNGADGILYRCTAGNTWVVQYTPYTYPHPLQGAASPPAPGTLGTAWLAAFHGNTFAVFIWPRSTDANHKAYNIYRCTQSGACANLVKTITPASAAAAHSPETQWIDSSLYVAGTYYYSVSDVNLSDYVGPANTAVGITVTGKQ